MLSKKWAVTLFMLVLVCAVYFSANAYFSASATETSAPTDEAQNITTDFNISSRSVHGMKMLTDDNYMTKWQTRKAASPAITFESKKDVPAYGIYICFAKMPEEWCVEVPDGEDGWKLFAQGKTEFLHTYMPLPGLTKFRIVAPTTKKYQIQINELALISEGVVPSWVQQWEQPVEKADMLVIVAHPDDELISMGGTIPTYGVERGMDVLVAYLTTSNTTRSSELLNGLWSMGYRTYPILGPFGDHYSKSTKAMYEYWKPTDLRKFIMGVIRQYKPSVVVTHDLEGEYGHGAHMACAEAVISCVEYGDNDAIDPDLYETYGGWKPQKLYLHLYPNNPIILNWRVPLTKMNGITSLELAQNAFKLHLTQRATNFEVTDEGKYSTAEFGLYYSSVGPDADKDDFMENIPGKGNITYVPPTPQPVATPAADGGVQSDEDTAAAGARSSAWHVEWPLSAGPRNSKGFLKSGEYVYENEEEGVWFFASTTSIVRIDRRNDTKNRKIWYEAHLFADLESGERLEAILSDPDRPGKESTQVAKLAREHQAVFAMNTDYYTYRSARHELKNSVGVIVRNGQILYDSAPKRNRSRFPNLDMLSIFEDGSLNVYYSDEFSAQELVNMGAVNVFSFGPYLVRDGELNPFVSEMYAGRTAQPRCALGIIEEGHYYAMLEEGRIGKVAKGTSVEDLAEHMLSKGCTQALNMDGGQTAVFTFMGKQIIRIARYQKDNYQPRPTTEIIAFGQSSQIDPLKEWPIPKP